jgi:hypothetical protein
LPKLMLEKIPYRQSQRPSSSRLSGTSGQSMAWNTDEKPSITVRRAAMNLLARREQSFFELTQKLFQKFPDFDMQDTILPALERLREETCNPMCGLWRAMSDID